MWASGETRWEVAGASEAKPIYCDCAPGSLNPGKAEPRSASGDPLTARDGARKRPAGQKAVRPAGPGELCGRRSGPSAPPSPQSPVESG